MKHLENPICAIYFDGRKDETLTALGLGKEEHIILIGEHGLKFTGHVVTPSGSPQDECNAIFNYIMTDINSGFDEAVVAGCDGTNTNRG